MATIVARAYGLAARFRTRAQEFLQGVDTVDRQSAERLKRRAIQLSSGGYSTAQLQQMARVLNGGKGLYSKASPMPPLDLALLNAQSGLVRASWQSTFVKVSGGNQVTLSNSAPYFNALMQGTATTLARTTLDVLQREESSVRQTRMTQAKRQAMTR